MKTQDEVTEEKAAERIHTPQQNSGGYLRRKKLRNNHNVFSEMKGKGYFGMNIVCQRFKAFSHKPVFV